MTRTEVLLARAKDAINLSSINQTDVKAVRLMLPPLDLQQSFTSRVSDIQAMIAQQGRMAAAVERLVQSLMADAFDSKRPTIMTMS